MKFYTIVLLLSFFTANVRSFILSKGKNISFTSKCSLDLCKEKSKLVLSLSQNEELVAVTPASDKNMETAWRYIKKPLLRIGKSGLSESHGNSLRDLLSQHGAVKVKINTGKLGSLEEAFEQLKILTENAGADKGVELLRSRPSDSTVMIGASGIRDLIQKGEFPSKKSLEWEAKKKQFKAEKKAEAREARENARRKRGEY